VSEQVLMFTCGTLDLCFWFSH